MKNNMKKLSFCIVKVLEERSRIRIRWSEGLISLSPDPHQNVTDPQHWLSEVLFQYKLVSCLVL